MANVELPEKENIIGDLPPKEEVTTKITKKEKVIKGKAIIRKKPIGKRIAELFGAESGQNIFDYLIGDILIPAAKNTLSDFVSEGVDMALGIDTRRRRRDVRDRYGRFDYGASYRVDRDRGRGRRDERDRDRRDSRTPTSYEDIVFETRADANRAIGSLCDIIESYGQASIGDLFDAAGISAGDYTDRRWGWYNIASARITPVRDGYMIDFPKPELLKQKRGNTYMKSLKECNEFIYENVSKFHTLIMEFSNDGIPETKLKDEITLFTGELFKKAGESIDIDLFTIDSSQLETWAALFMQASELWKIFCEDYYRFYPEDPKYFNEYEILKTFESLYKEGKFNK